MDIMNGMYDKTQMHTEARKTTEAAVVFLRFCLLLFNCNTNKYSSNNNDNCNDHFFTS